LSRLEARRINSGVDTDFFSVAGLETRSVCTLSYVDLGIVMSTVMRKLDVDLGVVVSAMVGDLDVDVGTGVSVIRSVEQKLADGNESV